MYYIPPTRRNKSIINIILYCIANNNVIISWKRGKWVKKNVQ